MTITPRDLDILKLLRRFKYATTAQIRTRCFPQDEDGATTRGRLRKLREAGLLRSLRAEVGNPLNTSTAPVFLPTETGCSVLATETGDMNFLLDAQPGGAWQDLNHYVAVTQLFLTMDEAVSRQQWVRMNALYFEHDIINRDAKEPAKKYRLHSEVGSTGKRVVCVPDAAFELQAGPYRRAYYIERERGTDTPQRVAAKKTPGFAGLASGQFFKRHFPDAADIRVLAVCPNAPWRDALRKAVSDKPAADLWRFVSVTDITAESFLHGPIIYTCTAGPEPFVKLPTASPVASPLASPAADVRTGA